MLCLLGVFISVVPLGALRLYGLYLEHRISDVTARIAVLNEQNSELSERYSSLLSPSRIYNYARAELGMVTASEIETIKLNEKIDGSFVASAGGPGVPGKPGFFARFFTGVANAKN
ncbi:hypothetical protein FACS1894216_04600 [Synergistales bacterium]|nr:hypothetical protein FACS1894216_04600 [Synergistales bacterium]